MYQLSKPVRCNSKKPTPYVVANIYDEITGIPRLAVDLGSGNGRNSEYLKSLGYEVMSLDAHPRDGDIRWDANVDNIPVDAGSAHIVLCNYLLMFLEYSRWVRLTEEADRVLNIGGRFILEMHSAKQGLYESEKELSELKDVLIRNHFTNYNVKDGSALRCILIKNTWKKTK